MFEKVYNTAEQNAATAAMANSRSPRSRSTGWLHRGGTGLLLRAKHAVFDRLKRAHEKRTKTRCALVVTAAYP